MSESERSGRCRADRQGCGRPEGEDGRDPEAEAIGRSIRQEIEEEKKAQRGSLAWGACGGSLVAIPLLAISLPALGPRGDFSFLLLVAACTFAYALTQSFRLMAFHRSPLGFVAFALLLAIGATSVVGALYPCGFQGYRANESSAIASLKTIVTAEEQYKSDAGRGVYASLTQLSATTPQYLDSVLGAGKKSGYSFTLTVGTPAAENWTAVGFPTSPGKTGDRRFFVDFSGVIRFHNKRLATSADSPIE